MTEDEVSQMDEAQLIVALKDMAQAWSKERGLCHDYSQGVKYHQLIDALKSNYQVDAHIDTVEHHDDFQLIIEQ
ncbi:hypothetical protein [Methylophaga nitratireducenticrescens]|uniref:hypothetical protein n=1 Tax=Methylophaga nitratireducenticrescens TaxID=754476 RepID=UPI000CDCB714|nr:hypothetical protein [Methylophaga nitratireducenticrescens]AUZ86174.1 hypothetical protein CDW43_16090 [Methylophaga nitratireducenticrescens]